MQLAYGSVVEPVEGQQKRAVEKVGERQECIGLVEVEQQHAGQERHALHLHASTRRDAPRTTLLCLTSRLASIQRATCWAQARSYGAQLYNRELLKILKILFFTKPKKDK